MEKFLLPFLYSFSAVAVLISFLVLVGKKILDKNLKRYGGGAVILIFVASVLLNRDLVLTGPILGIVVGSLLILLFGYWDDVKNLGWKKQLLLQIIIALAVISFGVKSSSISNPFGGSISLANPIIYIVFFVIYYLLFMNSLNWMDGIDGLSGSVTLIALATILFLSLKPEVNQPATSILTLILGGAIIGFLVFNWKPSQVLAGTAGAWFFGFILASLSIFAGAKIATVLVVSLVPIFDLFSVMRERHRANQSIFLGGDSRHLHFRLLQLGLTEMEIILLVAALSALIGMIALNVGAFGKLVLILSFAVLYLLFAKILHAKCRGRQLNKN